jgi:hypothetical protein
MEQKAVLQMEPVVDGIDCSQNTELKELEQSEIASEAEIQRAIELIQVLIKWRNEAREKSEIRW